MNLDLQNIVIVYSIIGISMLMLNVLILGITGDKWLKSDLLIVLTWPLDIVNLLGILIGALISKISKISSRESNNSTNSTKK